MSSRKDTKYALNSCYFSKSQDSWVQEGNGINFYHSNNLAKFPFLVSTDLGSDSIEILVLKGGILLLGDTTIITLNWKLKLAHGYFRLLC